MNQYTAKRKKIEDAIETFFQTIDTSAYAKLPRTIQEKHLLELKNPCMSLVSQGGKRWRPLLLVLCAEIFLNKEQEKNTDTQTKTSAEERREKAYAISPLVELIHTASLIHDDIEDASDTRRGLAACHISYGLDTALNAGSWLYFAALNAIETSLSTKAEDAALAYRLLNYSLTDIRRLHLGQAMDIAWHKESALIPSSLEYEAMIALKTGSLARLSAIIGASIGGASEKEALSLGELAMQIGIGFQIIDDYSNLTIGNPGKKRGDDIVEGKKSYPILLHLEKKPEDLAEISKHFQNARVEGIDSPSVEKCIAIINTSDALKEAKEKGEALILDSCNKIVYLYDNNEAAKEIQQLFFEMLLS